MFGGSMRRQNRFGCVLASAAALWGSGGITTPATAQEKPNPRPLEPYIEPELDLGLWTQVYAMANRPRLLVLCGYGTDRHQAMDPGQVLSNLDSTAVTHKIRSALIGELNAAGADIEMVDDNAVRALMVRLKDNANQSGEMDAADLLKQQLGADQVILVRLTESGLQGSPFSVVVESSDLARGRTGASFPFDWKGGTDAMNIKANARAVAIKYVNDFAVRVNHPVRFTVEVFGAGSVEMQKNTFDALNGLSGLRGQTKTRTGGTTKDASTGKTEAFHEYEVTFVRGSDPDPTQLVTDIDAILRARYNMIAEPRQSEGGRIAIRVRAGEGGLRSPDATTQPPAPGANAGQPTPSSIRSDIRELYTQRGSPRTVVLINRAASIDEWNDWRSSTAGANGGSVLIGGSGAGSQGASAGAGSATGTIQSDPSTDPRAMEQWARQVEQAVSQSLAADYGVSMQISPDLARASMLTSLEAGQRYMGADQLLGILRKEDVADIAVLACGKVVSGVAGYEMVYTVETVEIATTRRLGAAVITSPLRVTSASDALGSSSESFAARTASQAASAMKDAWSAGATVDITINGVASDEEARAIAQAVRLHSKLLTLGVNSSFRSPPQGQPGGTAIYSGSFKGSLDGVAAEMLSAMEQAQLKLALVVESRDAARLVLAVRR